MAQAKIQFFCNGVSGKPLKSGLKLREFPVGQRGQVVVSTSNIFADRSCRGQFPTRNVYRSAPPPCFQRRFVQLSRPWQLRRLVSSAAADGFALGDGANTSEAAVSQRKSTFLQAVLNVMNILMGVGLLSIPYALRQAGWLGLAVLAFLGFVTNYAGKALIEAHAVVRKRTGKETVGYEDIAEAALGRAGRALVSAIMYVELFGTCALLFILQGDNLTNLLGKSVFATKKHAMIAAAAVMIPTVWLPDVTALSYLGFLGVIATISVVGTVIFTFATGGYVPGAETALINPTSLPLTFGIMAFVYAGHGVFPSIQASMQKPKDFDKVLNLAYALVGTCCALIAALGYYMYGNRVADVIIFSLPAGPLALLCSCLILINPLTKYALTLEPVCAAVQGSGLMARLQSGLRRVSIRGIVAVGTLVSAMYVPYLAMVMSLIGSVLTISVSVFLPALFHLKLCHGNSGSEQNTRYSKGWDYTCLVVSLVCAVSGTAAALKGLAEQIAAASLTVA
uniref:Solute carrier family 32 (Vesicular inhibitory amino acid transporter) n=1 Tax=Tetraselmis sp. GSL018 TaxID=582737 RepID=A0A061SET5_9CHLO|mmetsp:Transcript_38752/g.91802  ORF Transcript_38752/g.91802 Transcript_38752/m.91802 type:complete len:508 (+) Transcript_38752:107-1630(+)